MRPMAVRQKPGETPGKWDSIIPVADGEIIGILD
jgi:hypothetical protein